MHLFLADQVLTQPMEWTIEIKTIRIGGRDVPEPLRVAPAVGESYWLAKITELGASPSRWHGHIFEMTWLKNGFIHATEAAAQAHSDAIVEMSRSGLLSKTPQDDL